MTPTRPPFFRALLASLGLAALGALAPPPAVASEALRIQLDAEVQRTARKIPNLAVRVVDLAHSALDYSYRGDARMVPASNQKLLTTAAALSLLGPGYTYETQVGLRGTLGPDGVLVGDLAVRGAGDPTISGRENGDPYAVFRRWAAALRARGVQRVAGDLYLEQGLFRGPTVHPDWPPEQRMWWYEAPVAALSFNDNCQLLRSWAAKKAGTPAILEAVPRVPILQLNNRLRTVARGGSVWAVNRAAGSRVVDVSGKVDGHQRPLEVWVTVHDPVQYFGLGLADALRQEGIEVQGSLRAVDRLPGPWWELVTAHRSLLVAALETTNKRSQNFYAEAMFKLLGARFCGEGTWEAGARVVSDFLVDRVGWKRDQFQVADGSGLSRNDVVTASQMTQLLEFMVHSPYGLEFMRSLPYSGEPEASLHARMTQFPYRGNVFAKTGTIAGVSTLSGYAKGRSGRLYAFSILANGAGAWEGRLAQDRIVSLLVDGG